MNASDACSALPGTITSTIVPVPTNYELSSIWGIPEQCFAYGADQRTWALTDTASFNITDILATPVPLSIVTSQPWCATQMACAGPAVCASLPYKPQLVVPAVVLQDLNPAWASCSADLRGLFDPPIALTTTNSEVGVTAPQMPTTKFATPASGPTAPGASKTGDPSIQQTAQTAQPSSNIPYAPSQGIPNVNTPEPETTSTQDNSAVTYQSQDTASVPPVKTTTTNALSILASAEASIDPSVVSTHDSQISNPSSADLSATGFSGSIDPSAVSQPLTFGPGTATLMIGSSVVTVYSPETPSAGVVVGSATLHQGETTQINGMPISVGSTALVVGDPSASGPEQSSYAALAEDTFTGTDGSPMTFVRVGSSMVIQGAATILTLAMGSQTIVDGLQISLATSSDGVVIDGTTMTLSTTHSNIGASNSTILGSSGRPAKSASLTPAPAVGSCDRLARPYLLSLASCVLLGLIVA